MMHKAMGKYLGFSAIVSLMFLGLVSDSSAATIGPESTVGISMVAHVAFENSIAIGKESDVTFSYKQTGPNDKVMLDNAGNILLVGKGEAFAPYGRPSVITIGDSRGQILNLLLANYSPGGDITFHHAHCALKGYETVSCDTLPITGKQETVLYIGVDVTVADGITPVDNKIVPSFDMSVVYQ